jgi:hypothetical protein
MSQKIKSTVEVLIGLIFIFGYIWLVLPLYYQWVKIFCAIPVFLFFIYSNYRNKGSLKELGFRLDTWHESFKILLIFTSITIPIIYVIWHFFFPVNNYFYQNSLFWLKSFAFPFWALFQEYILLAFFFRRYRDIFSSHTNIAIFFSALTFSMAHIPNPPLIIFCFAGGILFAGTYNKYPNLFTIAISHSILAIFCSNILLVYTMIGPNTDIGRWSKKEEGPVYGHIERVNYIEPQKQKGLVNINRKENSIFADGWIAGTKKIKSIRISLGGRDYPVHYGTKREDVAAYFNNPEYLYSGFNANIPSSDFTLGYHKLFLKVCLEGELFYHSPGQKIWVRIQ